MILLLALMHDERGGTLLSSFWYACVPRIRSFQKPILLPTLESGSERTRSLSTCAWPRRRMPLTHGRTRQPRIEDRQTLPELRWFWAITVYVDPKRGIITNGRVARL